MIFHFFAMKKMYVILCALLLAVTHGYHNYEAHDIDYITLYDYNKSRAIHKGTWGIINETETLNGVGYVYTEIQKYVPETKEWSQLKFDLGIDIEDQRLEENQLFLNLKMDLYEGKYANQIWEVTFKHKLKINTSNLKSNTFHKQTISMQRKVDFVEHEDIDCLVDVSVRISNDFEYLINFVPHGTPDDNFDEEKLTDDGDSPSSVLGQQKQCFDNHQVYIRAQIVSDSEIKEQLDGIVHFSVILIGLIIIMVMSQCFQACKFIDSCQQRQDAVHTYGTYQLTYCSKFSFISNLMIYSIFWQTNIISYYLFGEMFVIVEHVPKEIEGVREQIAQIIIWMILICMIGLLSVCCNEIQIYQQIYVFAIDFYFERVRQYRFIESINVLCWILAFFSCWYARTIFFHPNLYMFICASVWIPQIYRNTVMGSRFVPNIRYAFCISAYVLYIPVYLNVFKANIFKLKPQKFEATMACIWASLQIIALFIQGFRPRFLMPERFEHDGDQYHRYEHMFEQEAQISSNSYTSSDSRDHRLLDPLLQKQTRSQRRLQKMKEQECIICLLPMSCDRRDTRSELDSFFKTPCNHKFHKECLLQWMVTKHQCPICREVLPMYNAD